MQSFKAFLIKFVLIAVPPVNDTISAEFLSRIFKSELISASLNFLSESTVYFPLAALIALVSKSFSLSFSSGHIISIPSYRGGAFFVPISLFTTIVNKIFIEKL